jgi:iron complex outermembrane recepter protein
MGICRATISTDAALRAAAAASVQGQLADLWAGPLSVAAGLEFRRDSTKVVHDDLSNLFAYFQNFGADYEGDQDVVEGFIEADLPLVNGVRGFESLSLNAAIRQTRYDISGFGGYNQSAADNSYDATTWKVGLVWEPVDWTRLRFTMSEDIRAANFSELFLASASSFGSVQNRLLGGATEFPALLNGGNPALGPETGKTWTVGLVVQPPFIEGLSMSIDYYDIRVDEYVGSPGGAQVVVDRCQLLSIQQFCDLITYGAGQTLIEVANANVNLQWLKNRGLDWEIAYRLPLSRFSSLPGNFNFRLLANRTLESASNLYGVVTDRAGETGGAGAADWVATLIAGYANEDWHASLTTRFISQGAFNVLFTGPDDPAYNPALANTVNDNTLPSSTYFNLNGGRKFGADRNIEVFGQINNLFDRAPPFAPQLAYPTNPVYFDQLGRSYRVGVRMSF